MALPRPGNLFSLPLPVQGYDIGSELPKQLLEMEETITSDQARAARGKRRDLQEEKRVKELRERTGEPLQRRKDKKMRNAPAAEHAHKEIYNKESSSREENKSPNKRGDGNTPSENLSGPILKEASTTRKKAPRQPKAEPGRIARPPR